MTNNKFNFNDAVKELQAGKSLNGKDGVLTSLVKQLTEAALQAEIEQHLDSDQLPNRKNGVSSKTIKSSVGSFELNTPRDRNGSFEPQLVKKNQTTLSDEIDHKILSMFSMGMSYRDINKHIEDMYGMNVATGTISAITDKLIPELKEWQQRPLDSHYPIIWLDAIHYKVKENGRYISKAVYTILALNMQGKKEI